jgi:hypothetical protein
MSNSPENLGKLADRVFVGRQSRQAEIDGFCETRTWKLMAADGHFKEKWLRNRDP